MIDYVYKAKDQAGELVSAHVQAENPQAAAKVLREQGLFVLDVVPEGTGGLLGQIGLNRNVSLKDRVIFTRQLATLINAGLPLARALRSAEEQVRKAALKRVVNEIISSVEGGSSLSQAFAQHPKTFNNIYIALVAAGETSGTLDKALERLADQQEKEAAIVSKVRSAMVYPAIVLVLIILVLSFMVFTVVPQVAQLFHDLHKDLPFYTLWLVDIANFAKSFWWIGIPVLAVVIWGLRKLLASENIEREIDRLKLRIPLFGPLFQKVYMARFSRTMNTLLASGIPMLQAMETARNAVGSRVVAADIDSAIGEVRGGKSLSKSLEPLTHFHPLVAQMAGVGEESGAIDDMLGRAASYYEDEVDEAVKNLSTTLEPVMMVVLGLMIVGILLAVMGPVYGLIGSGDLGNSSAPSVGQ